LQIESLQEAAKNKRPEIDLWGKGGGSKELDIDDIDEIEMIEELPKNDEH
jgi:hypothetical protein